MNRVFPGKKSVPPVLAFGLAAILLASCGFRSDSWYERHFYRHEADFNRIIQMSKEDAHVVRVAPDFTWLDTTAQWPRPDSQLGFTRERWDEYRRLFKKTGVESGFYRPEDNGRRNILFLPIEATGMVTGGIEQGYAYTEVEPSPLVDSLEHLSIDVKSLQPVFKKLRGNWYLYYLWDD